MSVEHHPILSLFRYIKNYQSLFTWSCTNSILNKTLDLMPPLLVGWLIDSVRRQPPEWIASTVGHRTLGPLQHSLLFFGLSFLDSKVFSNGPTSMAS